MNYTMEIEVSKGESPFVWRTYSVTADEPRDAINAGLDKARRRGFQTREVTGLRAGFNKAVAVAADQVEVAAFYESPNHYQREQPYEPFPFNTFAAVIGGANWVIARRTPNILARYGEDVICLSQQRYQNAERLARLELTEGYD